MYNNEYYLDFEAILEICRIENVDEDNVSTIEINIFKYEMFKVCIERILSEFEDMNDGDNIMSKFNNKESASFKIAFNTLLKNNILKIYEIEDDE